MVILREYRAAGMSLSYNKSTSTTTSLNANEFFYSLESIPDYVRQIKPENVTEHRLAGATFTLPRNQFQIMDKSFVFPQFSVKQAELEFATFKKKSIKFYEFLKFTHLKYPHISAKHCDLIYAYVNYIDDQPITTARKRCADIFSELESIEILSHYASESVNYQEFVLFQYIFHHYSLIFQYPSVILFLLCDHKHEYSVLVGDFAAALKKHFHRAEKLCLRALDKQKSELMSLQEYLRRVDEIQRRKEFSEANMFKATVFNEVDEDSTMSEQ